MKNTETMQGIRKLSFDDVWTAIMDTDREIKAVTRQLQKQMQESDRQMRMILRDSEKIYGMAIDGTFIPRLERQFSALGFMVERSSERVLFGNGDHIVYAEVDVFLENRADALAVAIKPQWYIDDALEYREGKTEATLEDIQAHLERMDNLRRYFDMHSDWRKLYGAVAAAAFPEAVLESARREGLYVIVRAEDRVVVRKPEGGARAW
jgi:hypothetical protein